MEYKQQFPLGAGMGAGFVAGLTIGALIDNLAFGLGVGIAAGLAIECARLADLEQDAVQRIFEKYKPTWALQFLRRSFILSGIFANRVVRYTHRRYLHFMKYMPARQSYRMEANTKKRGGKREVRVVVS